MGISRISVFWTLLSSLFIQTGHAIQLPFETAREACLKSLEFAPSIGGIVLGSTRAVSLPKLLARFPSNHIIFVGPMTSRNESPISRDEEVVFPVLAVPADDHGQVVLSVADLQVKTTFHFVTIKLGEAHDQDRMVVSEHIPDALSKIRFWGFIRLDLENIKQSAQTAIARRNLSDKSKIILDDPNIFAIQFPNREKPMVVQVSLNGTDQGSQGGKSSSGLTKQFRSSWSVATAPVPRMQSVDSRDPVYVGKKIRGLLDRKTQVTMGQFFWR